MQTTLLLSPTEKEIDAALKTNGAALIESLLDLLAAVILCVIAAVSLVHAGLRFVFAVLGLLLWSLALLITFLYWLRSVVVARSASSIHKQPPTQEKPFHHDEINEGVSDGD